jgi:hypothetical protein
MKLRTIDGIGRFMPFQHSDDVVCSTVFYGKADIAHRRPQVRRKQCIGLRA